MQKTLLAVAALIVLAAIGYHQFIYIPGQEDLRAAAEKASAAQASRAEAEEAAEAAANAMAMEDAEAAANAAAAADAATAAASNAVAEAQAALDDAADSPQAQEAAETAAQAADQAQAAARAATEAAAQALSDLSPSEIFTVQNYDPEQARDYIDGQELPAEVKQALKNALAAAEQTPETLAAVLAATRQSLGL